MPSGRPGGAVNRCSSGDDGQWLGKRKPFACVVPTSHVKRHAAQSRRRAGADKEADGTVPKIRRLVQCGNRESCQCRARSNHTVGQYRAGGRQVLRCVKNAQLAGRSRRECRCHFTAVTSANHSSKDFSSSVRSRVSFALL